MTEDTKAYHRTSVVAVLVVLIGLLVSDATVAAASTTTRIKVHGVTYTCRTSYSAPNGLDCARGSRPPLVTPDLYCDGYGVRKCSTDWYPSKLRTTPVLSTLSGKVVCRSVYSRFAGFGEMECYRYRGGDPRRAFFGPVETYCDTTTGRCEKDAYPSFLRKYEVSYIDSIKVVCERFNGDCWRWYGFGSPMEAVTLFPDYECDYAGYCTER